MRLPRSSVILLVLVSGGLGAQAPDAGATEPAGAELYHRYCAPCHGITGLGDGPVVGALRTTPPDLTTIARRAGGRFDEREVIAIIDGRRAVIAHGPREMPVWGAIFDEELKERRYPQLTSLLRAKVLAAYLQSIQK